MPDNPRESSGRESAMHGAPDSFEVSEATSAAPYITAEHDNAPSPDPDLAFDADERGRAPSAPSSAQLASAQVAQSGALDDQAHEQDVDRHRHEQEAADEAARKQAEAKADADAAAQEEAQAKLDEQEALAAEAEADIAATGGDEAE